MGTAFSLLEDRITAKGTLDAGAGTTVVVDVPIPTDRGMRLTAEVVGGNIGTHYTTPVREVAEGVFLNNNGTLTTPSGISTSSNPKTASNLATSDAQISQNGGEVTLAWSINGTNARLTLTSSGAGNTAIDVLIIIDTLVWGSV